MEWRKQRMKIVHIEKCKYVEKTKKELLKEKEMAGGISFDRYKQVPLKEPTYIVEMTPQEIQLVSFYLELEKRKPIVNVKLETKLKKGKQDE